MLKVFLETNEDYQEVTPTSRQQLGEKVLEFLADPASQVCVLPVGVLVKWVDITVTPRHAS